MNLTAIRRAIYGRLSGDATLNNLLAPPPSGWTKSIYYNQAPKGARFPFVIFSRQSSTPEYTNQTKPAFEDDVWLVKAVDGPDPNAPVETNMSADKAEAISMRVNTLLSDANLSISGGDAVLWLRRQSDIDYPEDIDGKMYVHSGSLYRLVTEPA